MHTPLVVALFVVMSLSGCTTPDSEASPADSPIEPVNDLCAIGVCAPGEAAMEEVGLQENAMPVLGFHEDFVAAVNGLVRVDDGWALTLRDADGRWSVLVADELGTTGRSYPLPSGTSVAANSLLVDGDMLYLTTNAQGATQGVTLHTWNLETDAVATSEHSDIPAPATPKGAYGEEVLLIAKRGLLSGDTAAFVATDNAAFPVEATGRVMDAAMATGLLYLAVENGGNWTIQLQSTDGNFSYVAHAGDETIDGVWAEDAKIAFSVIKDSSDPSGGRIFEVSHRDHKVSEMGQGWDVRFDGNHVAYLTREGDSSPFVAEWNRDLQDYSDGVFLPDGEQWDMTADGLWWLEQPRTDPRFKETVNPSPYVRLLMEASR